MNTTKPLLALLVALAALAAAVRPAAAISRPDLSFAVGGSFGSDGHPDGGGMSLALQPTWPVGDHGHFGASLYAHDIGSTLSHLYDPNTGVEIGTVALDHRWTWGASWLGEYDFLQRPRWSSTASATFGWSRVEDDVRGDVLDMASAVEGGIALGWRHELARDHQVGLLAEYDLLSGDTHTAYQRTRHYAALSLTWRWLRNVQP